MLKRRSGIDARAFVFNAFIALKRLYGLIEALTVINDVKARVSRYMSYLLRHNPEDLELDDEGFVGLDELCTKVKGRYPTVDSKLLIKIVDESERKRFEIVDNKIRALYGHSIYVRLPPKEEKQIERLYHGTTPQTAEEVLERGLQPMSRKWVHLSPTKEIALEAGKRRTDSPVILLIDVSKARSHGIRFFRATDKVYVCKNVPAKHIRIVYC